MKIKGFLVILVLVIIIAVFIFYIGIGEKKVIEEQVDSFVKAEVKLTQTNMNTIKRAIDSYAALNGNLPQTIDDLSLSIPITTGKLDAWGNEIKYEKLSASEFRLISAGADRTFNTGDDIIIQ